MSLIEIKPLREEDCYTAAQIHKDGFYRSWKAQEIKDLIEKPMIFGLKVQSHNNLLGFILWSEASDEAEILTLVIHPSHQRQGLSTLLLQSFFSLLMKKMITKIFIEVAEDNRGAIALYKSLDFIYLNQRPNYYSRDGGQYCTAMIYVKELPDRMSSSPS